MTGGLFKNLKSHYLCHGFSFIGLGLISFIGLVSLVSKKGGC
jgi:hypothetical protein